MQNFKDNFEEEEVYEFLDSSLIKPK